MFLKIVVIFLLVMMLIGMVGKLFNPDPRPKKLARKCPQCGGLILGRGGRCKSCAAKGR